LPGWARMRPPWGGQAHTRAACASRAEFGKSIYIMRILLGWNPIIVRLRFNIGFHEKVYDLNQ
ncbi:MAG: hypothetical protein ACU0C9_12540, partial [Paracoccaceae bacterium]